MYQLNEKDYKEFNPFLRTKWKSASVSIRLHYGSFGDFENDMWLRLLAKRPQNKENIRRFFNYIVVEVARELKRTIQTTTEDGSPEPTQELHLKPESLRNNTIFEYAKKYQPNNTRIKDSLLQIAKMRLEQNMSFVEIGRELKYNPKSVYLQYRKLLLTIQDKTQ